MFTSERLRQEWRCEGISEQDLSAYAAALNIVEEHLGQGWIDSYIDEAHVIDAEGDDGQICRQVSAKSGRALLSLRILSRLGALLSATDKVLRFPRIRNKLKTGAEFSAAWSELLAAESLLLAGFQVEFAPSIEVNGRRREADLAVIVGGNRVIAEVFRPSSSKWQQEASEVMQRIFASDSPSRQLPRGHQLSIALRRVPTPDEEAELMARIGCRINLARNGIIAPPEEVGECDPSGPEAFAHICLSDRVDQQFPAASNQFLRGRGLILLMATTTISISPIELPPLWLMIGIPFQDTRGEDKLKEEMEQLPDGQASLLIIDISESPGVAHAWKPAVHQFMINGHSLEQSTPLKPSAIWFMGETITPDGPVPLTAPVVYENPNAPQLPPELRDFLRKQGKRNPST
ncbi:MAG: hypothetical protein Q7O66_09120 [Dehalococcoidia bacterium]|nr:hypothetical protein [Dehalococcoidia bacterium]